METRSNKGMTDFLRRLSFAALLLLCLPPSASAQYKIKGGDITSGLIAHWKLDETSGAVADDAVGPYNGTLVNSPAWEPTAGKIGGDLDFNGSNTEVTVADNAALDWGTGNFSYAVWVKTTQNCSGTKVYVGQTEADWNPYAWLGCRTVTNVAASDTGEGANNISVDGTTVINDGKWHHLALVKEGHATANLRLYVDGNLEDSKTGTYSGNISFTWASPTRIGHFGSGPSYYADADIDDVRIYNRALSSEEVGQLYSATNLAIYHDSNADIVLSHGDVTSGLVSRWEMEETGGTAVADERGNYNATWINGTIDSTAGQIGNAFSFTANASDEQVNAGNITQLNSVGAFTITAWIRDDNQALRSRLICKSIDLNNDIKISSWDDGRLYLEIGNGGNTLGQWNSYTATIPQGQWYHAAFVFDGSGVANADRLKIYANGVNRSLSFSGTIPATTANLAAANFSFGDQFCENGTGFDGALDDIRVYSRALTAAEVVKIYEITGDEKVRVTTAGRVKAAAGIQPGWSSACTSGETGTIRYNSAVANPADAVTLPGSWYSTYGYRRAITINSSQVAANATGFPVAFIRTIADLRTTGNGGDVTSATGADIVFTDSDGTTLLKYEQEKYVATTGEVVYWIKADLSATVDKTIYMYYGKAGASNLEDPVNVWPSTYKGVWHMAEDPTISTDGDCGGGSKEMCDSTSGNNDLDTFGNVVSATGYVNGAAAYDGNEDYLRTPNGASSLDGFSSLTISLWMYPDPQATTRTLVMKGGEYRLTLEADSNRRIFFTTNRYSGSNQWSISAGQIPVSAWTHVVVTYDGVLNAANDPKIYINGTLRANQTDLTSTGPSGGTTNGVWIGEDWTNVNDIDATLDEVRVSDTIMSANDITTMYNNMNNNAAFMTVGSEMPSTGDTALVAHWKLNETSGTSVADSAGSNTGTWSGETNVRSATGKMAGAFDFDGVDDKVNFPNSSVLDTTSGTWAFWVKTTYGVANNTFILGRHDVTSSFDGITLRVEADGSLVALCKNRSTQVCGGGYSGSTFGVWHHVAFVYSQTNGANNYLYVDGAQVDNPANSAAWAWSGDPFRLGDSVDAFWGTFDGMIDDVRIYNRALTASEIVDLYNFTGHNLQFCDGSNWISVANSGSSSPNIPCTAAAETFTTAGLATTTVPANCTTATIEAWGAGGGGGYANATAANRRSGGGGGGSGVERGSTMLVAAGGGGGGGVGTNTGTTNHRGGGGGGYVIANGVAVTPAESLNIYVGGGGNSSCSGGVNGAGGGYNGIAGAQGTTPAAVTNPPGVGGGGGNGGANNGGNSTYGGAGGNSDVGNGGTSPYGGNGGNNGGGVGGNGFGGTATTGSTGGTTNGGAGASGGGLSAGDGAAGNNCSNVGGGGRVKITWTD